MRTNTPAWQLRKSCPVCEQGSALTLVACPTCSTLALICAEEGSAFLDPHALAAELAVESDTTRCRGCAQSLLRDFVNATATQIQSAQISLEDYE